MLFKFAAPTMLIAVLLHTFIGTVAGTPQGPVIISCRGPNDHSVLPEIFAATTQELGCSETWGCVAVLQRLVDNHHPSEMSVIGGQPRNIEFRNAKRCKKSEKS
ncbi:MAG: hypothetical protein NXY57DRAFT_1062225 [Lentinula lateritia]|nr:MAG: hypothetical protein NXY57DRAFT_1062225 [Lentinula lateritia]